MPSAGVLFAGIGGDALGLERAGFDLCWFVEHDEDAATVLDHQWPTVPLRFDVRYVDWHTLQRVDLLAGGFPCQDISNAHTNGERRCRPVRSALPTNGPGVSWWPTPTAKANHCAPSMRKWPAYARFQDEIAGTTGHTVGM